MDQENQKHQQESGVESDSTTSGCNEGSDRPESIPSWRPTDTPPEDHTGHNDIGGEGQGAADGQGSGR